MLIMHNYYVIISFGVASTALIVHNHDLPGCHNFSYSCYNYSGDFFPDQNLHPAQYLMCNKNRLKTN